MIFQIIFAIVALFATNTTTQIDYVYIEFRDVRDLSNDAFNLNITYELCEQNNSTQRQIDECKQRAFERAISIDA